MFAPYAYLYTAEPMTRAALAVIKRVKERNCMSSEQNEHQKGTNGTKKPLKFLFVAQEPLSGDLAWQLTKEGHAVKMFIKGNDTYGDTYDGFVEKVPEWKTHADWADIIVFDDTGFGAHADTLRKDGKLVVGGSTYTDRLEEDREFGQEEMKRVGMLTLPHWDFEDYDAATEFIKKNPGRYVFKPSGNVPSDWKSLLFISTEEDGKDLIEILASNKVVLAKKIKQFQLQKFVAGVEIAVSAFFNGERFLHPVFINFEHKRLFPGDIGPMTGEMGTLAFWSDPNPFFKATLERMEDSLKASGYVGVIDINCIVNGRGIYPLEFTCRFGYPTISVQIEGILNEWGEFLAAIARHELYPLKTKRGFQIGIVCTVPPFPYADKSELELYRDSSILFKRPNPEGIHLGDVKLVDGVWRVAGDVGYVLVITGSGVTVSETRKQAYGRIEDIMLQNMFYRTDIGLGWGEASDKLQTWGYLH